MNPSALKDGGDSFKIDVVLGNVYDMGTKSPMKCLLDTGATAVFVPATLCKKLGLTRIDLDEPFIVHTADTEISLDHEFVGLSIEYQGQKITFSVLPIGSTDILLGLPFLRRFDIFIAAKEKYVASRIDFLKYFQGN